MSSPDAPVIVELYGIPRQQAGVAEHLARPGPVIDVLRELQRAYPGLEKLVVDNLLARHYLVSHDGQRFVTDLSTLVNAGSRLLLLSADAGG